jgi:hypothetical protein
VADFNGDGRLDFATTGYYTPGYFLCDDPRNIIYRNRFAPTPMADDRHPAARALHRDPP